MGGRAFSALLLVALALPAAAGALAVSAGADGAQEKASCGGEAPLVFWCTLGEQRPPSVQPRWGPDYTGTLESVLLHDSGERRFWCGVSDGLVTGCGGAGVFPAPGASARVECWSYHSHVYGSPMPWLPHGVEPAPQSVPYGIVGGAHGWECVVP